MCSRKSEISAFVEKKIGLDGNRTLIQDGFCPWCNAGLIFAQDIEQNLQRKKSYKSQIVVPVARPLGNARGASPRASDRTISGLSGFGWGAKVGTPCRRVSPLRLQTQALLDPNFGYLP